MSKQGPTTILVTVTKLTDRDKLIKRILTNLTKEPSTQFTIQQDQVNRIRIYHEISATQRVLVRTYLVIVLPIFLNLEPIENVTGTVDLHLEETIQELENLTAKLRSMQGRRYVKEKYGPSLEKLVGELC